MHEKLANSGTDASDQAGQVDEDASTNLMLRVVRAARRTEAVSEDDDVIDRPPTHLGLEVIVGGHEAVSGADTASGDNEAEPCTNLYYPKVEVMLARLDDGSTLDFEFDAAGDTARHLRDKIADLWLLRDNYEDLDQNARPERKQLEGAARRMLDDISEAIDRAGALIVELQQDDGLVDDLEPVRGEAVAAVFKLRKLFGRDTGEEWGEVGADEGADIEINVELKRQRARDKRAQARKHRDKSAVPRRRLKLVVALVLFGITGARLALLFVATPHRSYAATTVRGRSTRAVLTVNRRTVSDQEVARGTPTMVLVDFFRDKAGNLVANPIASHPRGLRVSYEYAWFRNAVRLRGSADRIAATSLAAGKYWVVVWAVTGRQKSRPMKSASLVIK